MSAIEVIKVCKSFKIPDEPRDTLREHFLSQFRRIHYRPLRVLDNISLTVRQGETLGIMGRNGSGKSTLLKIIAGIYRPDSGEVIRNGLITPILQLGVGWNPALDAIDNIHLIGTAMGMTIKDLRAATGDILDFADLRGFERLELRHYSSGMAARLAYSVAFRAVREILILDEIFAVGDAGFRERCYRRYRQLHREGKTVLLVSHNAHDISSFCERAVLLEHGRVVEEGTGDAIVSSYQRLLTQDSAATETSASATEGIN